MDQIVQLFTHSRGWKRYILSALMGLLVTFSLPPFFDIVTMIVGFSGFFIILSYCDNRKTAFLLGWWFGFGQFVTSLYWISNSLLVDAARFAWLIPFAILLIPAICALFVAAVSLLVHISRLKGFIAVILFALLWVIAEIIRSYIFWFPWNLIGYSWLVSSYISQFASIVGVYGLSILAVIVATIPATIFLSENRKFTSTIIVSVILLLIFAYGSSIYKEAIHDKEGTKIRIVQGNIPQQYNLTQEIRLKTLMKYVELSKKWYDKESDVADILVWPESAIPFILDGDENLKNAIAEAIPKDSILVSGSFRVEGEGGDRKFWNSIHVFDDKGDIIDYYDKYILVPFGEFIPFKSFLPFLDKITEGAVDFSRGSGAKTLHIDGKPSFSPLICYEGIFSGMVIDDTDIPNIIINITNDAWFGDSIGPYQHMNMVRMRAIEERIPVIRAANTGISVYVDKYGNILKRKELNDEGVIDFTVSADSFADKRSFYSQYKNIYLPIVIIFTLILFFIGRSFQSAFCKNTYPR